MDSIDKHAHFDFARALELVILFLVVPSSFTWSVHPLVVVGIVLMAVAYATRLLIRDPDITWASLYQINLIDLKSSIFLRVLGFMLVSTALVAWFVPEKLFIVLLHNPLLWVIMSFVYIVFSVYPQEILYRVFFFQRYKVLVQNPKILLALNAVIFCFAHLFFKNALVFALTLAGGFLFAYSYLKKGSIMLTSIEHSLYGWWLFTLGLGDMLAFPGP